MPRNCRFAIFTFIALFATLHGSTTLAAPPEPGEIEASMARALEVFNAPGMAVSVVYRAEVYYSGGQGLQEIGNPEVVTDRTLFQIGSVSKAFTAAALALLVDEGKLNWDDRVIDYLPEFRMYDPWVTREFTIRDLLTHRSGLPLGAGDLLLFPEGKTTRDEVIHAMRYLEPASSFRAEFAYDNLMYIIAGEVVARVSGMQFEDFLETRLLAPLGMSDCFATLERVPDTLPRATPHVMVEGEMQTTNSSITPVSSAAGGINCSAAGMARWMRFMLDGGATSDGEQLISAAQFKELVGPVTLLPTPEYLTENAGSRLTAYALGWNVSTFYGQPAWSHGGGVWGMTTFLMVLPEQDLAVFASNNQLSAAPRALVNEVVDGFLSDLAREEEPDWFAIISDVYQAKQTEGAETVAKDMAARVADSSPSLPLETYTGIYRDPWYGDIHISLGDDGRLWFRSDRSEPLSGPLEHFQFDTFIARWTGRQLNADAYVSFVLTPEGGIERIRMKAVSPTTDFSFDFHDLDLEYVASE